MLHLLALVLPDKQLIYNSKPDFKMQEEFLFFPYFFPSPAAGPIK
jgi:hypothetical protein